MGEYSTKFLACSAGVFSVVRNIVVAAIFDFMTVEDWRE